MAHTTSKYQVITIDLVEYNTFQNTCLTIVFIKLRIEITFGECPAEENATVTANDAKGNTIIDKLLASLVLYHLKAVISHTSDSHLIVLVEPDDIFCLVIRLHTDRSLWLRNLYCRDDDIVGFLLLGTTGNKKCRQQDGHQSDCFHLDKNFLQRYN